MQQIRVYLRLSAVPFIPATWQSTEFFSEATIVLSSGNTNRDKYQLFIFQY